jgi:Nif-specific regulatory protein
MSSIPQSFSQQQSRLTPILKICQKMNSERDLSALLDLIAREATGLLDADRASIFVLDAKKGELWSKVALGSPEILRFDSRLGIAGAVAHSGRIINVTEVHKDPRFYAGIDRLTGYQTTSLLAAPLRNFAGQIIGAFEVLNSARGAFSADDEEILVALAAQAGVAIETAQLLEDLRRHRDQLSKENVQLRREIEGRFSIRKILGNSRRVQDVLKLIEQISHSSVNVLITGESGTGKELAAKAIHYHSPRARQLFVALNCAAIPENLLESELFGIEKGVATGVDPRKGKFETAHGGTLFLDEIGDLSPTAQAKLLRVLQEGVIERIGGRKEIAVDVRILSATNKDLAAEIKNGRFRQDLYYRLKVVHIQMPALRDIPEDIPLLTNSLVTSYSREMKKPEVDLSPEVLASLQAYAWPGNVRELENEVKRLVASCSGRTITVADLSESLRGSVVSATKRTSSLKATVADLEKRMITEALKDSRHNQRHAANALGLSRQGLIKKMKRYGIKS